ncbi:hypothetical protein V2I01_35230 [Micromonospora sp. BRA006-A]|nr:hypothetical protein [Micromonospora sp. BRA006-A]
MIFGILSAAVQVVFGALLGQLAAGTVGLLVGAVVGLLVGAPFGWASASAGTYGAGPKGIFLFVVDHTWSLLNTFAGALYLALHLVFGHQLDRVVSAGSGRVNVVEGVSPGTPPRSARSAPGPARASSGTRTCTCSRPGCSARSTCRWWRSTTCCSPSRRCGCSGTTTQTRRSTGSPATSRSASTRTCGTRPSRTASRGRHRDDRRDRGGRRGRRELAGRGCGEPVPVGPPRDDPDGGLTVRPLELRPARQTATGGATREPYRFVVRLLVSGGGPAALPALDRVLAAATTAGRPGWSWTPATRRCGGRSAWCPGPRCCWTRRPGWSGRSRSRRRYGSRCGCGSSACAPCTGGWSGRRTSRWQPSGWSWWAPPRPPRPTPPAGSGWPACRTTPTRRTPRCGSGSPARAASTPPSSTRPATA